MRNINLRKLLFFGTSFVMLFLTSLTYVNAQSTANYSFTTNTTGSLGLDANANVVDMSSGTTQLVAADLDDNTSAVTSIGFDFYLMGTRFTQFSSSSNGLIQLGAGALSTTNYLVSSGTPTSPLISALATDLRTGSGGKVHYKLVGTAPNRCLVVEFLNMSLTYVGSPGSNDGTYQVRLYESSGVIEFVYGSMFRNASTTGAGTIGTGFSFNSTTNNLISVATATNTSNVATPFGLNTYTNSTNIPNLHSPTEGSRRVYRFSPSAPNAPSGLTFSDVLTGSMGLNWTDNSANELSFVLYNSTDGINYTFYGSRPANTTSTTVTGLLANTLYYWRVYAITEGALSTPVLSGSQSTLPSAPISGIKTVGTGGDYSNLTIAFSEINANTLSGNIDLQLITGYPAAPETYPIQSSNTASVGAFNVKVYPTVAGLSITSNNTTGTLNLNNARNITFDGRVNQAGANDLVIANSNAGASYAILLNNDASNNTIQNCIVQSTNTSTTSGTIVFGTTTGTNGNDNNTVSFCDVRDGATTPTNGIYSVGTTTSATHFNDNNTITNNNISNFFSAGSSTIGVFVGAGNSTWTISNNKLFQTATRTYTSGNTHNGIQVSNTSGNGFVITGNTIGYASAAGTGTYTMAGTIATRFIGINVSAGTTVASSVQGNTISGFSLATSSGATAGNGIFAGINVTGGNVNVGNVTPNIIGAGTGTGAIAATTSTAGGLVVGINSSSTGSVNISSNTIGSINVSGTTATLPGSVTGIQVSGGTPTINNNTIGSTTTPNSINAVTVATSGAQLVNGINVTSGVTLATSIQSNTIANLTQSGTTTAGVIRGIAYAGTGVATISQNTISFISGSNANTSLAGTGIQGILHNGTATGGGTISNNTIHTIVGLNTGTVQSNVNGIGISGLSAAVVTRNIIYNLQNASTGVTATTPPTVSGIIVRSIGAGSNINNNMISLGNAQTTNTEFVGIWNNATSANAINVYHNSINIEGNPASGALPSYAFLRGDNSATAITSTVDVRNNIFNNTRSGGTGKHYAIANQSTVPSATGWGLNASNFNVLNANAATVGLWGSTDAAFNAWRIAASSDANSFSAIPVVFVNTATGDLHLNMGVTATPIESGAIAIASVTTDIDNQTRPGPAGSVNGGGTAPDLGADEIDAVPALPVITINSVTPPATSQCATAARLVSVNVTTPVGTIISVNIGYSVNGVPQSPIAMVNTSGNTWEGTIPASTPANATIVWGVSATNSSALSSSINGTTYADEPLFGTTATAVASVATICSGNPSNLTATLTKPGSIQLGVATTTTNTAGITPFNSNWEGSRTQYLIRASELQALGLGAGNITNMGLIVTAAGAGTFQQVNYTIKMAHTANAALTSAYGTPTGSFTTVFTTPSEPAPAVGIRNYTFSTPFNWDGVSNVLVDICHDNDLTNACGSCFSSSSTVQYSVTSFNSVWGSYADNIPSCGVQATNTITTFNNRPNMIFTGTVATPITSVTWMDGATTVGTGNPLTVNPTATTTYTANITALGCVATPAPTATVTVNPLPTAPTAVNSAQCGTQIPAASVTSTSGLPTPTFIWYDAAVAGTAMQTSTSTTYTSNVASTTTFYVSELNTATGCESARTPVTVTVATADGVSASTSSPTICIGNSITLTAANTNPTPNQSYSYTWSSTANSGASTPVAGSPAIITPTQPGTYTYSLTAVDGGCNAVATVDVTVDPFAATLAPINVTCNGYNNGSFFVASSSCGTLPYTYSVNGGPFDVIPTNLAPGTYSVVVQDNSGYLVAAQNVVITEPSTTIAAPTGTNASVCQGDLNAPVAATSVTNAPTPASVVVNFSIATQPTELSASTVPATVAASPNAIATATMAALPAGAIVTGATLNYNNIVATGNSWQSDVRLGLVGAVTQNYTAGTGTVNSAGTFNYASTIPAGSVNVAGGTITMHYFDFFNDNAAGTESTFPTGANVASITINYTVPTPASITWWNAASAGTQIGAGSPFETVGTSVLPNTNTPGVYTVYAQGEFGGCNGLTRTPVTVTVNAPSASTTTITACGSYTWTNGTTYTASGIHTQTLVNAAGCDSIATLNLTINQPTSSTVTVTACGSYTWAENATTYNTSGSYPVVLAGANAVGCDSTVTLNLTINQPTSSTVTVSACGSYTWAQNTTTYTTSGSYPVVLAGANANGCDSTITLNLTINQPTSSTVTVSACGSYTWAENTTTYTTSGSYPVVLAGANANGCDSTITLNLTINQPTSSTVTEVACGSYTWAENTTTYTTSGSYQVVLAGANANGCDSTITLNLTINQPTSSTVAVTECESYYWALSDSTYTASGSYDVVLANANAVGCDSTVTLNLTINQPTTSTLTATECESFYWALSDSTYTASGSYQVVLPGANANGCDSIATLVLTITGNPIATATDNDDATITASAGTTYQWINCATNTAIAGATSQTYTATANGDYAVVVTNAGGCSDTSSCVTIDYIGLTEITDASIQVFPNPTNSDVTITMTAAEATVEVVDAQGKLLQAVTVGNGEKVTLSSYETGVYFLRIRTANGSTLERVVKQ
jgi:trimeric autotransporter adhesin